MKNPGNWYLNVVQQTVRIAPSILSADFARLARRTVPIQYFDQRALALDMIVLSLGALQGDVAGLLGAVHVGDLNAPETPALRAQGRVEHFRQGLHLA